MMMMDRSPHTFTFSLRTSGKNHRTFTPNAYLFFTLLHLGFEGPDFKELRACNMPTKRWPKCLTIGKQNFTSYYGTKYYSRIEISALHGILLWTLLIYNIYNITKLSSP